ncbi:hypothetical protein [Mesorhizobium sp. M0802]|uniref:hypothetical protein n=1 Tax=Mesorhizobium sp. M0802 TaxID=2957001 RepID=UPI00333DBE56
MIARLLTSRPEEDCDSAWVGGFRFYTTDGEPPEGAIEHLAEVLSDTLKSGLVSNRSYARQTLLPYVDSPKPDRIFQALLGLLLHRDLVRKYQCRSQNGDSFSVFVHQERHEEWYALLADLLERASRFQSSNIKVVAQDRFGGKKGAWFWVSYAAGYLAEKGLVHQLDRFSFEPQKWVRDAASHAKRAFFLVDGRRIPVNRAGA